MSETKVIHGWVDNRAAQGPPTSLEWTKLFIRKPPIECLPATLIIGSGDKSPDVGGGIPEALASKEYPRNEATRTDICAHKIWRAAWIARQNAKLEDLTIHRDTLAVLEKLRTPMMRYADERRFNNLTSQHMEATTAITELDSTIARLKDVLGVK